MTKAACDMPRDGEAGFTLVEALVAFMIVALTLTMGLRVLGDGARAARRGPEQAERLDEAVSIMNGLLGADDLRPGTTEGRFADGQTWRSRVLVVTPLLFPKAKMSLMRVELYAGRESGGAPLLVTLAAGR